MPVWQRLILAIIVLFGTAFGLALWIGSARWNGETHRFVDSLNQPVKELGNATVSFSGLDMLPAPVARYFRMALKEGQPLVRFVRIVHKGNFLTSKEGNAWSPFESTQYFRADPPGFVWDARIRMAPMIDVRVRDAYLAGKGSMRARVFSVIPVMDEMGKAELDAGALQRYLAEAVWFPTALLPGRGVKWTALDDSRALATLTDSGSTVSLEFRFNEEGEIADIFSPGRYREVKGKYELTPWTVRVWNYEERGGMRIPLEGEVAWQLPDGRLPYWRGTIIDIGYDFVR